MQEDETRREELMKKTLWRVRSIKDCFLVKTNHFQVPDGNFTDSDEFVSIELSVRNYDEVDSLWLSTILWLKC